MPTTDDVHRPTDLYGRVCAQYSAIDILAIGGMNPGGEPEEGLILAATDDYISFWGGANGHWAAVRIVLHGAEREPNGSVGVNDWDETDDTCVSFSSPPFLMVGLGPAEVGIEPTLHDLGIPAGTYDVTVSANGRRESFKQDQKFLGRPMEAISAEDLLQQFRIDFWPVPVIASTSSCFVARNVG